MGECATLYACAIYNLAAHQNRNVWIEVVKEKEMKKNGENESETQRK